MNQTISKIEVKTPEGIYDNIDNSPGEHPYLTKDNIKKFREYSQNVWEFALTYCQTENKPLRIAFAVNMAQNMYKWAKLAQKFGAEVALFPNTMDQTALSCPEWEEFDGEFPDIFDGEGFLEKYPDIQIEVPCYRVLFEGTEFLEAYQSFLRGNYKPFLKILSQRPRLRPEQFLQYQGFYPCFAHAKKLAEFEVVYVASTPYLAYFSGKPYCFQPVGGDLIFDCGRGDDLGKVMSLAASTAQFLMVSNPHILGHCRRLGFTNGVYLPYPMDDSHYCPGEGKTRASWEAEFGPGIYVLMTARLDKEVKGLDESFIKVLFELAKRHHTLRFIFLTWGNSVDEFRKTVLQSGLGHQFILLSPVGKQRLIDYYRSSDIILDQFIYGHYGATLLEAAAIGKPVIMNLRAEQYDPLYRGDVAPVMRAASPREMGQALEALLSSEDLRLKKGLDMRAWLVRNHGEERTVPLMLALLRLAADDISLPADLINPLLQEESEEEKAYHAACLHRREEN